MNYKNKVFKCSKEWTISELLTKFSKFQKEEIWYKAEWKTPWKDATLWIGGNYIAFIRSL